MDLLGGYSSSSDEYAEENVKQAEVKKVCLPSPDLVLKKGAAKSVFTTKFEYQEKEADNILEQHVKMVENNKTAKEINGKKVCWMYRKGRCRFGSKCQMFHDSELQSNLLKPKEEKYNPCRDRGIIQTGTRRKFVDRGTELDNDGPPIYENEKNLNKKKKFGINDSLTPNKNALYQIQKIKVKQKFK